MTKIIQTTEEERKTIRKLNRNELGDDIDFILSPIFTQACDRAKRRTS